MKKISKRRVNFFEEKKLLFSSKTTSESSFPLPTKNLPTSSIFYNTAFDKNSLKNLVAWVLDTYGEESTLHFLEQLKEIGFQYATQAGVSIGLDDLQIFQQKAQLLSFAFTETYTTDTRILSGKIDEVEKAQKLCDVWNQTSDLLRQTAIQYFRTTNILNPIYMMAFSGARGNISQVRQLVAMRGLMADPQGKIIEFPIQSNFREGLTLTEYFISCYGARKGLVDTALRTATAGYLTRRLVYAVQHLVIGMKDCGSTRGLVRRAPLHQSQILGRVLAKDILFPPDHTIGREKGISSCHHESSSCYFPEILHYKRNASISKLMAEQLSTAAMDLQGRPLQIKIRSPLTCNAYQSICQFCYGWDLSQGNLVDIGEAIGIIAGQAVGEPGTQLTMRTFHTGGVGVLATNSLTSIYAPFSGIIHFSENFPGHFVRTPYGRVVYMLKYTPSLLSRTFCHLLPKSGNLEFSLNEKMVPPGSILFVKNGEQIQIGQLIAQAAPLDSPLSKLPELKTSVRAPFQGEIFIEKMPLTGRKNTHWDFRTFWLFPSEYISRLSQNWNILPKRTKNTAFFASWYQIRRIASPGDLVSHSSPVFEYQIFVSTCSKLKLIRKKLTFGQHQPKFLMSKILYKKGIYFFRLQKGGLYLLTNPGIKQNTVSASSLSFIFSLGSTQKTNLDIPNRKTIYEITKNQYCSILYATQATRNLDSTFRGRLLKKARKSCTWPLGSVLSSSNPEKCRYQSNISTNTWTSTSTCFFEKKAYWSNQLGTKNELSRFILNSLGRVEQKTYYQSKIRMIQNTWFYIESSVRKHNQIQEQFSLPILRKHFSKKMMNVARRPIRRFASFQEPLIQKLLDTTPHSQWKKSSFVFQCVLHSKKILSTCVYYQKQKNQLHSNLLVQNARYQCCSATTFQKIEFFGFHQVYAQKIPTKKTFFNMWHKNTSLERNSFNRTSVSIKQKTSVNSFVGIKTQCKKINVECILNILKPVSILVRNLIPYGQQYSYQTELWGYKDEHNKGFSWGLGWTIFQYSYIRSVLNYQKEVALFINNTVTPDMALSTQRQFGNEYGQVTLISPKKGEAIVSILPNAHRLYITKPHTCTQSHKNPGAIVRWGDEIQSDSALPISGQVLTSHKTYYVFRKGLPFLSPIYDISGVSQDTMAHLETGELVEKNEILLTLKTRQLQTEDIVQGIPKIEQLFEARKTRMQSQITSYEQLQTRAFQIALKRPFPQAIRISIRQIQERLLQDILCAYSSQGVKLAEKHVELLVREMTSKVRILDPGDSNFLPGEIVLRVRIERINHELLKFSRRVDRYDDTRIYKPAIYQPLVLGLTRTSVYSNSFLVAASFQEVSRVLLKNAIMQKQDFLHGLHENVMVGQLIPAGTGYRFNKTYERAEAKSIFKSLRRKDQFCYHKKTTSFLQIPEKLKIKK